MAAAVTWRTKTEQPTEEELKNVPQGIDALTFFAPRIPSEVRAFVPILHEIDIQLFRPALEVTLVIIRDGQADPELILNFRKTIGSENRVNLSILLSGLYTTLRYIIRHRIKANIIERDLIDMHLPPSFVDEIIKAIKSSPGRLSLENALVSQRPTTFPTLEKLKWRVDVTISSSTVSRVLKPTILMQAFLSNGQIKTFEVPVTQFHQLRYRVAKLLTSMQELERHPIVRLVKALEAEPVDTPDSKRG